jgi:hypothetical protein
MGDKAEEIRMALREDSRMAAGYLNEARKNEDPEQMNYWTGAMVAFDRAIARAGKIIGS